MINVSNEYRNTIMESRRFRLKATLTFPDSVVFELGDSDIFESGMTFDEATSDRNSLQIGFAYIGSHKLILDNFDGKFDDYDFTGATVVSYVGLELSETTEYLNKGFYTVDDMGTGGNIITLSCFDNMNKFARPFSDVEIVFPTTAQFLLTTICNYCGVPLATTTFSHDNYTITERPIDEAMTCLDMVSYIGQVTGNFAKCNTNGALELKWYDLTAFEESDSLDGGRFDSTEEPSYQSGDNADGGNFTNYSSGDNIDGGTFLQTKRYHHFYNFSTTPTISVDDVVITGIKVMYEQDDSTYSKLFGSNGYVLSIENNPLIQSQSDADIVANNVGAKIVGMRFRPFSANILSDPSVEAGDPCRVSVRTSRGYVDYPSFVTSLAYTVGQRMAISGDAETPSRNSSTRYSAETKAIVENRKKVEKKLTAYNIATNQLANLMANSFGVHKSEETLEDGSTIYYMHDKPTLAESQTIWKMTADAFAVSTDGGETWNAGFDSEGNAVVNILNAVGINADWINVGSIRGIEIITDKGKIAGLNITENGLSSDNDIVAITNSYNAQGEPIQGKVKVRDSIPNPEEGLVDSYSEVGGDGFSSRASHSTDPFKQARTDISITPAYGFNIDTYNNDGDKTERLSLTPTVMYQKNLAKSFIFQMLGGAETVMFSEDGINITSQNKITLWAPDIEIDGYIDKVKIDGRTMLDLEKRINYNLQYILNIVIKLASMSIDVDPPPPID